MALAPALNQQYRLGFKTKGSKKISILTTNRLRESATMLSSKKISVLSNNKSSQSGNIL